MTKSALKWQRLAAFADMRAEGAFFQAGARLQRSYMITDDRGACDPGPHVYATFCDAGQKAVTLGQFETLDQARNACETHARGGN